MDKELQNKINELTQKASGIWKQGKEADTNDPIIKLLLLAIASQTLEIEKQINRSNQEIADLFQDKVLPYNLTQARPAFSILQLKINEKIDKPLKIDHSFDFIYEKKQDKETSSYNFKALVETNIIPAEINYLFRGKNLTAHNKTQHETIGKANKNLGNTIWIGLKIDSGTDTLSNACFQLNNLEMPDLALSPCISLYMNNKEIPLIEASELEKLKLCSIFENSNPNDFLFGDFSYWKNIFLENQEKLYYIGDYEKNSNPISRKLYPTEFQEYFTKETLEQFTEELIWLNLKIDSCMEIDTEKVEFQLNCVPVVNVDAEQIVLDAMNPIVKLQKSEAKQFLNILYDRSWGKHSSDFPVIIRNMGMERFNPNDVQKQIQYLFNKFTSDYFAFKSTKGLRDGIKLNNARKAINELYVSCMDEKLPEYTGYYALLNLKTWKDETVVLNYLCCDGVLANQILKGTTIAVLNPSLDKNAVFTINTSGGKNEANEEEKKHIARYHILTNDKLITAEDIRIFCYKELGTQLQSVDIRQGTVANSFGLCRGVKVTIKLKNDTGEIQEDYRNSLSKQLERKIAIRSAIVFPVEVKVI